MSLLLVGIVLVIIIIALWDVSAKRHLESINTSPDKPRAEVVDPLYFMIRHFYRIITGDISKRPDAIRIFEEVVMGEAKDSKSRIRGVCFFGIYSYTIWDVHIARLIFNNPDMVKPRGLLETFERVVGESVLNVNGDVWTKQRHLMNPAFKVTSIKELFPVFKQVCNHLVQTLHDQAASNGGKSATFEVFLKMAHVTMDIIGNVAFSYNPKALEGDMKEEMLSYNILLEALGQPLRFFRWYSRLPLESNKKVEDAHIKFDGFIDGVIEEKRKEIKKNKQTEPLDLLDALIMAHDVETDAVLNDIELSHNAKVIFLAGHETSSAGLTYALYLLSRHPDAQKKAQEEADAFFKDGEPESYSDLSKLNYITAVLKEALRLYPPAPTVARAVEKTTDVGGYTFRKGQVVNILIYAIHHLEEYWPRAQEFLPERFIRGTDLYQACNMSAWMPFGGGPRICIGMELALTEMKLVLAYLLHNFTFYPTEAEIRPGRGITMRPLPGFTLTATVR